MAVSDCIRQFAGSLDVERMQTLARAFEEKGMSPDTAIVRVAAEERVRLQNEFANLLDIAGVRKAEPEAPKVKSEPKPEDFSNAAARQAVDADPARTMVDENGVERNAKEALDEADARFQQEQQEVSLYKVAVACAIGVGE